MKYLLDSNICIHLFRNKFNVAEAIIQKGWNNCCISQITKIELLYGAECSEKREQNLLQVNKFLDFMEVVPIETAIPTFCRNKAILRKQGKSIDDFDLLIASTAVANNLIMVTENISHFDRIEGIEIENWVKR